MSGSGEEREGEESNNKERERHRDVETAFSELHEERMSIHPTWSTPR